MTDLPYRVLCDQSDRQRWLRLRHDGVGASEVAALFGCHPYCDVDKLLADKLAPEPVELTNNKYLFWGNALEPAIIAAYNIIGHKLPEYADLKHRAAEPWGKLLQSVEQPALLATPDAWQDGDTPGVLQIKTASKVGRTPSDAYILQVQAELAVTGFEWGTLAIFCCSNRELRWWDIKRDETVIKEIFDNVAEFWAIVQRERAA